MNLLDQTIEYFAPQWQLKRAKARHMLGLNSRNFEAASKGRRTENWKTTKNFSDPSTVLHTIVDRSRYLAANNAYAKRGLNAIPSHVVRRGITPNISSNRRFEKAFRSWAASTKCDFEGRCTFYGLQWLAMKTIAESGEVLIRKRLGDQGNQDIPLKLQVLEPDFLDTNKPGTKKGIEYSEDGQRLAYWVYREDPRTMRRVDSVRIPADEIIHAFELLRPGQQRGLPWLTPVIIRLKDLDDYEDAQLVRQKIASCLVGVIHDMEMDEPAGKMKDEDWSTFTPGSWEILPPGKTVTFNNPPVLQGYGEYLSAMLHGIASGLQVPYEVLTSDYEKVNFSSSRMAFLEFYKTVEHWQEHIMVSQICNPIFNWATELAAFGGISPGTATVNWGLPKREYVDPIKEIKAQIMSIRAGLTTLAAEIRKSGEDPDELLEEYAALLQTLDSKRITLDSDPRVKETNDTKEQSD